MNKLLIVTILIIGLFSTACGHTQSFDSLKACAADEEAPQLCLDRHVMSIYTDAAPADHLGDPSQSLESVNRPETILAIVSFRELISNESANPDEYVYYASVTSATIYLSANARIFLSDVQEGHIDLALNQRLNTIPTFHAYFAANGVDLIDFDFQR